MVIPRVDTQYIDELEKKKLFISGSVQSFLPAERKHMED